MNDYGESGDYFELEVERLRRIVEEQQLTNDILRAKIVQQENEIADLLQEIADLLRLGSDFN